MKKNIQIPEKKIPEHMRFEFKMTTKNISHLALSHEQRITDIQQKTGRVISKRIRLTHQTTKLKMKMG